MSPRLRGAVAESQEGSKWVKLGSSFDFFPSSSLSLSFFSLRIAGRKAVLARDCVGVVSDETRLVGPGEARGRGDIKTTMRPTEKYVNCGYEARKGVGWEGERKR